MSSYENALAALAQVSDIICDDAAEWLIDSVEIIEEILPAAQEKYDKLRILLPCAPEELSAQPVPYGYYPDGDWYYICPTLVLNNLSTDYNGDQREVLMGLLAEVYCEDTPYTVQEFEYRQSRSWREVLLGQPAEVTCSYVKETQLERDSWWKTWEIRLLFA